MENAADPRVARWAHRQDAVARAAVRSPSRVLYKRMKRYYRLPVARSVEATRDGYLFFYSDDRSYCVDLIRRDRTRSRLVDSARMGKDTVIQEVQARGEGGQYALHHSVGGSDEGFTDIMDINSGEKLDSLQGDIGSIVWLRDSEIYYVRFYRKEKTPDGVDPPATRVFLRRDGKEEMAYGKGLKTNTFIDVRKSNDGTVALVDLNFGWTKSTPVAGRIKEPEKWTPLVGDSDSIVSHIGYDAGRYYLLSFKSSGGSVVSVVGRRTRTVVPESATPLQGGTLVGNDLLCTYLVDSAMEMKLYDSEGRPKQSLKFDVPGSLPAYGSPSSYKDEVVFAFTSFALPYRIYRLSGGRLEILASEELPGEFDVEHRHASSLDGTQVHYFVTKKRGKATAGVLLFGYGGFRVSVTPTFNPSYIPLLEDGISLAVANLRGGLEKGESWHRAGMRENKHRVFEDYVAVAESLRHGGHALVGFGRSNGGLLMGATMNLRPDLFSGMIIGYPVLDMLAFHRLHIGKAWVPEYGDPEDSRDAKFLAAYSPYHNLADRARYPPVFLYTGLKDDRVHPAHAFKFHARLKKLGGKSLLRVETESGHIGTTPDSRIREEADKLAFAYDAMGIKPSRG